MKKYLLVALMLLCGISFASAQAEIRFDKVTVDFGTFPESNPVKKTTFTFTNVGNQPLVINQVVASCGCTVPQYDKRPIAPGQKRQHRRDVQRQGKIPRTLQEEYHRAHQR